MYVCMYVNNTAPENPPNKDRSPCSHPPVGSLSNPCRYKQDSTGQSAPCKIRCAGFVSECEPTGGQLSGGEQSREALLGVLPVEVERVET